MRVSKNFSYVVLGSGFTRYSSVSGLCTPVLRIPYIVRNKQMHPLFSAIPILSYASWVQNFKIRSDLLE